MRSTLDKLVSWIGLGLAAVMLVAGGLLTWASNFVDNEVKTQFLAQDITMPDQKGIDALENQADKDALTPFIGYAASAALAKTALLTHRNVGDLVVEAGLMTREEVDKQLSPARLSGLEAITQAIPVIQTAENLVES